MLLQRTLAFSFDEIMFFMKLGLSLLTVLKIFVAKILSLFISVEVFLLFSSSVWYPWTTFVDFLNFRC